MKHIGRLEITSENQNEYMGLIEVIGDLYIEPNCELKALISVSGYLHIESNCELKALTSVGGGLSIKSNCKLKADALTSVGVYLSINSNCELKADALTSVGGHIYIGSNSKLNIPSLKNVKWKLVDRMLFVVEKSKISKGIKIHSGYNVNRIEENKHIKNVCFVAEKGKFYSHGLTVKKAIQDLNFKIIAEKLKHDPINADTMFTVKYYRLLTGSCDIGCRYWMANNGLKFTVENEGTDDEETVELVSIRADELLPMLEKTNAYGVEKFKQLVNF